MSKELSPQEKKAMQEKLAKEWENKQVTIPIMQFGYLMFYQGILPFIPPCALVIGFFYLWKMFSNYWYAFVLALPVLFIVTYFLYIIILTELTYLLVEYWTNRKSPQQEGEFARDFKDGDVEDTAIKYYHIRGFLYKWPVFFAKKSIFPWIVHYILNHLGENEIHKNAMYLDAFVGLEMIGLDENAVVGDACVISSHIVDSIFGSLTIRWVRVGKNSILLNNISSAPGSTLADNTFYFANAFFAKGKSATSTEKYFYGVPARPMKYEGVEAAAAKNFTPSKNKNVEPNL